MQLDILYCPRREICLGLMRLCYPCCWLKGGRTMYILYRMTRWNNCITFPHWRGCIKGAFVSKWKCLSLFNQKRLSGSSLDIKLGGVFRCNNGWKKICIFLLEQWKDCHGLLLLCFTDIQFSFKWIAWVSDMYIWVHPASSTMHDGIG